MTTEPVTLRDLRSATPRKLEEYMDERGIEIPPRADSPLMRQLIVEHDRGSGGPITTADLPPRPGAPATTGAQGNPLLSAALSKVDTDDLPLILAEAVLDSLTVDELDDLAEEYNVAVERSDGGDGSPVKDDYVATLASVVERGGEVQPTPDTEEAAAPATDAATEPAPDAEPAPAAPAAAPDSPPADDGLEAEGVTNADLRDLAKKNKVEVAKRANKTELLTALRAAGVRREA